MTAGQSPLAELRMYARFASGLPRFLQRRVTLQQAEEIACRWLREREANFLRLAERGIFGYRRSPYLPLLKLAGCELGDIRNLVRDRGLEGALRTLREAGVYVSFEEFGGREPIVRGGHAFAVRASDFDNPYLSPAYALTSGGSTGAGTRITIDLDHWRVATVVQVLVEHAHGFAGVPTALWRGVLPEATGFSTALVGARVGNPPRRWFTPFAGGDTRPALKYRLATHSTILLARASGAAIPWPEHVRSDEASVIARWAAETVRTDGAALLRTTVSRAARVSLAAEEAGLDLHGATFWGGGEPPTPAKVRAITRGGARWVPNYAFTGAGNVGIACARPVDGDDLHLVKSVLALIQHPRRVPGPGMTVPAFYFTSLLPSSPKLMLNVESDDYGVLETRSCGCALERYGLADHIREVRSFSKLTGEGVTLVGSEMERILQEVLPGRFGGTPLDYQLQEEESEHGFTRLSVLISPRVHIANEAAVVAVVLEALGRSSVAADIARATWGEAGSLRVRRQEPVWTARGKLLPLHLARRAEHVDKS